MSLDQNHHIKLQLIKQRCTLQSHEQKSNLSIQNEILHAWTLQNMDPKIRQIQRCTQ